MGWVICVGCDFCGGQVVFNNLTEPYGSKK